MIKEVKGKDLARALNLVNTMFSQFVAADYSEQGKAAFENYLKTKLEETTTQVKSGHKKIWGYYKDGEILGVIATQNTTHISLMFVDKHHHRKGIARQMFDFVLENLRMDESVTRVTVNSSPYAVKIYQRLGFVQSGEKQEKDGIIFIPMAFVVQK